MTRSRARLALAALAAVLALGAATAYAALPEHGHGRALRDCGAGHDPLVGHYSVKVLQKALHDL